MDASGIESFCTHTDEGCISAAEQIHTLLALGIVSVWQQCKADNSTAYGAGRVRSLLNYVLHNKHKPPKTALDLNSKSCITSLLFFFFFLFWEIIVDGLFLELSCIHIKVEWGNEVFTFIFVQNHVSYNMSLDLGFRKC